MRTAKTLIRLGAAHPDLSRLLVAWNTDHYVIFVMLWLIKEVKGLKFLSSVCHFLSSIDLNHPGTLRTGLKHSYIPILS